MPTFNYNDPLVPDPGYPLDTNAENLARDWIAPVTIPWPYDGPGYNTQFIPATPGVMRRGGPSPVSQYSGIPGFIGRMDPTTGNVSEYFTGQVFTWFEWQQYKYQTTLNRLINLNNARDKTSDLTNLFGTKPWFHDDWYKWIPDQRPINPIVAQ